MRSCYSCAGTAEDGCAFPERRTRPIRCTDCTREITKNVPRVPNSAWHVQTRASYRAALRWRASQAQMDLIDMVQPCP